MTRRASFDSFHSTSTFDSEGDDENAAGPSRRRRQLDFSASLTSFPRPPSSVPPSASIRSVSALSHVESDLLAHRAPIATTPPRQIRTHSRHASVQSAWGWHSTEGQQSPTFVPGSTSGSPSHRSAAHLGHRAQVSLDAVPAFPQAGSSSRLDKLGAEASSLTMGSSIRSRPSSRVQHARARSARFAPDLQPAIPQRTQQHRMSMPAGPSAARFSRHSAVTPDFEQDDPLASSSFLPRSTSTPLGNRPSSRPMSPSMSDDEEYEDGDGDGRGTYAAPMPSLTDSTLRMAPGVVGLGEGWAGGPQRKPRTGGRWWRRRRKSQAVEPTDDPLALWSVPEEHARKTSPLKAAWNRSMLAFGLVGAERHGKEEGPSAAQRARMFFSRSRLDLGQMQSKGPEHGAVGARTGQRASRRRLFPLVSRSQNDLAVPIPSIHVERPSAPGSSSLSARPGPGYSRRYAASQPHLPSPRSTSLSNDPFLSSVRRGPPPPWRPVSVSGPARGLTVPRITEVDEPSASQTSIGASASPSSSARRRGGARLKRSSTFGNGARDIAAELGLDEHRPPSVISAGDGDVSGDEQPAARRKTKTGDQRKSIMLGRPLMTRLKTSFTSITRSSRSASPAPSHMTPADNHKGHKKGARSQPGSEGSSSSAAPSTLLRTPVEAVMTVPLAPEAPMRNVKADKRASVMKGKKRMSWFGGLNASRARLDEMDEDAERICEEERPPRPASRGLFRRSRRHAERRASVGTVLDFEEGGAETAPAQTQAQAQRASWGQQRRPFSASVPALNRLSGSEFNLLRFSFPKDEGFANMFDGLRFTPRPSPAPATPVDGAVPGGLPVPGEDEGMGSSRDVVLAGTMEVLVGRRNSRTSTERAEGEDVVRDHLLGHDHVDAAAPESAPMRPDLSASTDSSASTVHPYNAGSGMVTPVRKTSTNITVTSPSPLVTPSSHHTHASENTLSTLAPSASTPRARLSAQQGYFQALALAQQAQAQAQAREPPGPPSPFPASTFALPGGSAAVLPTTNMPAPTSTFAWASRPGLPPRTGSFSSALSGRMGSVAGQSVRSLGSAGSGEDGVSPTMSMWHTPSGTPIPSPDPARPTGTPMQMLDVIKPQSVIGSPLPVFEEDAGGAEDAEEPASERDPERRPSFGSAMRPYTYTPGISSASASASASGNDSTTGSVAASADGDGYGYERRDSDASALLPPGALSGHVGGSGAALVFGTGGAERSRASLDAAFSGPVVGRQVAAGAGAAAATESGPRTGVPVGLGYGAGLVPGSASRDARLSKGSVASRTSYDHELDEHESLEDADIVQYDSSRPRQISEMVRKGSLVAVEDLMGLTPRESMEEGRV